MSTYIRRLITPSVLMSLGARGFQSDSKSLRFTASILPITKAGHRGSAARNMIVTVTQSALLLFDVKVTYVRQGQEVVHFSCTGVYSDQLERLMLALDYDGASVLNPRLVDA